MITRDCIRRGVFHSVTDLAHKIMTYIRLYNRNAQPFRWTYLATLESEFVCHLLR